MSDADPGGTSAETDTIDALCHHCGQAFSVFLHEMADQNAKVVCPNCRNSVDCGREKSDPNAEARPIKKVQ